MTNLRPNTLHNLSIKWKMIEDAIWSHIATLNFTTKVGVDPAVNGYDGLRKIKAQRFCQGPAVPKTSPLVLNKAIGNQFVGIYIKERSEDCYYGPISLVLNKTTPCVDGPRSRRSLPDSQHLNFSQTVFVKYNDTGNESVTLQYATSAGISSENSEVFFSTPQEVKNVKRLTVIKYNRTHDSLTIDSIDGVDSLHYYWCYGEYLEEKQLVDCKSIGHVVLKDVKKTSYIERRSSNANVNCSNCQLHYGVAIQQLNKTSSILWDSASEPLVDNVYEATGENQYKYLYIAVGILALVFIVFIVCCMNRCYRQAKKVPQPTWPMGKIEIQPYDSINQSYEPEPDLSSVSDSHQTDTTKTLSDSDQSDTFHTFIHTDSSTSGAYSTNIILKDISAQSS
ncbi:hypothetical protein LOTGIDRAFT_230615 [Lottia gigantea]|uniref:Uncharacterized protein n=1 Tax=Lottia gigantea TaxID=225164 RepID=V4CGM2_LOTGI|nr:hypothetical protein LOTGIDRAFT_230615 [Lottia gigantea]ESP01240.1 hypothetical protein LOTGIDRAFT_230615 [Lottia gigantea]